MYNIINNQCRTECFNKCEKEKESSKYDYLHTKQHNQQMTSKVKGRQNMKLVHMIKSEKFIAC